MRWPIRRCCILGGLVLAVLFAWTAGARCESRGKKAFPSFRDVQRVVKQYFDDLPGYKRGDIITQRMVGPLLRELGGLGWTVRDAREILARVPSDSDPLVQQLRTPNGRKFMQGIGRHKGAYDRLERITRWPQGSLTFEKLLRRPVRGAEAVAFLAADPKGIETSQMTSDKSQSDNFDKPTGRIYTEKMLLARLRKSHKRDK